MKFIRFFNGHNIMYGKMDENGKVNILKENFLNSCCETGETCELKNLKLLPPVEPNNVIAVGLNYKKHAQELKETSIQRASEGINEEYPEIFIKMSHTVIGQHDAIVYPKSSSRVDYECELAVIIGRDCYKACAKESSASIFGYTCLNDVTARDLQALNSQWSRCKNFVSFCPMGPCVETDIDVSNLEMETRVNGITVQHGRTSDMIFPPAELVRLISQTIPLKKGDVIATGTPDGIGPVQVGDIVEVYIQGIGVLRNIVRGEDV